MSNGPSPKSTLGGVDSSLEGIAALADTLRKWAGARSETRARDECLAADMLELVAKQRDEERRIREQMRVDRFHECESVRAEAKAAIESASRQLAEARAALTEIVTMLNGRVHSTPALVALAKARALLSGEPTK